MIHRDKKPVEIKFPYGFLEHRMLKTHSEKIKAEWRRMSIFFFQ